MRSKASFRIESTPVADIFKDVHHRRFGRSHLAIGIESKPYAKAIFRHYKEEPDESDN